MGVLNMKGKEGNFYGSEILAIVIEDLVMWSICCKNKLVLDSFLKAEKNQ